MQKEKGELSDKDGLKDEKKEKKIKLNNDIKDIRSIRQLDKVNLNYDSPRLLQAMDDLGVTMDEILKQ